MTDINSTPTEPHATGGETVPVEGVYPDAPPVYPDAPPVPASAYPPAPALPPAPGGAPTFSTKSFIATWLLTWLLGGLGIDRFYLGKVGTGILKLITFGGFGIWWLIDLILVLAGAQHDRQGHDLAGYRQYRKVAWIITGAGVLLSIIFSSISAASAPHHDVVAGAPIAQSSPGEAPATQPSATATPTPTAKSAATWADESFGTFAPIQASGGGDDLVTLPAGAKAGIVAANYSGSGNFSISVLDAANQSTGQLLVNTVGTYAGTTAYGFDSLSTGVTLQISADAAWSVTISPISAAPALAASGAGDAVMLYDGSTGQLAATHDGSANFVVQEQTNKIGSFGLLINEIGAYSGTVPLSSGPAVMTVQADGNWTLTVG